MAAKGKIAAGFPDFSAFYAAGMIVANGDGSRLYEVATQARVEGPFTIRSDRRSFIS